MKNPYLKLLVIFIISTIIVFPSCSTVEDIFSGDDDEEVTGYLEPEKSNVKSGEVVVVNATFDIQTGTIEGYFNDEVVGIDIMNNNLIFIVPVVEPGSYEFITNLNDTEYFISFNVVPSEIISNPEEYVQNVQNFGTELYDLSLDLDKELVESGIIDSIQSNLNQQALSNQLNKANQVLSQMTSEEKAEFARIYSANEYWINEFRQIFLQNYKSSQCESILEAGNEAKKAGNIYEARDHFLKYKHCKIDYYTNNGLVYYLNKFNKLIDDLSGDNNKSTIALPIVPVALALFVVYLAWDRMAQEVEAINTNPFAEDLGDDKLSTTTFINNQKTNYSKKVKFRAVDKNDINRQDIFGFFVGIIHDANEAIKRLLAVVPDSDIKPIDLKNSNQTIDFNRNFVIQNISNSNVSLGSATIVDDMWQVVFETNESTDQQFSYELKYDDGITILNRTYNATLTNGDPLLGTWEAFEVDGEPVGEWKYYYFTENCPTLIGWASITHKATLTLDGSNIIFYYDGSDKEYQYTDLDYTTCSYSSLNINESSDDDSYTSTYVKEGNKIIVATNDGPFPMTYQLTDQNNTLIVNADGEINKYHRAK